MVLAGVGVIREIGKQIRTLGGAEPFINMDQSAVDSGIFIQVVNVIRHGCDVEQVVDGKTQLNPTDNNVHDRLNGFKENGCGSIILLGGWEALRTAIC